MAPLIDIVFLLLIFFLVATMLKQADKQVDIELPEMESVYTVKQDDSMVVIAIDRLGDFYVDGEEIERTNLLKDLREVAAEDSERYVRLDIDRRAPMRSVGEVMHFLDLIGLENRTFKAAEKEEE